MSYSNEIFLCIKNHLFFNLRIKIILISLFYKHKMATLIFEQFFQNPLCKVSF